MYRTHVKIVLLHKVFTMLIRPIEPRDNTIIAAIIRSVLTEFEVPTTGTAFADPQLDYMFEAYNRPEAAYFVVEMDGKVVGGAGIDRLPETDGTVCELQKMYFLEKARGIGAGSAMIAHCLTVAAKKGYTSCYLETMPNMHAAQALYTKSGFEYICAPMGNTGHTSCPVWMLKKIEQA